MTMDSCLVVGKQWNNTAVTVTYSPISPLGNVGPHFCHLCYFVQNAKSSQINHKVVVMYITICVYFTSTFCH